MRMMSFHWQRPLIYKITYNWYEKYSFENKKKILIKKKLISKLLSYFENQFHHQGIFKIMLTSDTWSLEYMHGFRKKKKTIKRKHID